jgi:Mce-associated membrane protein
MLAPPGARPVRRRTEEEMTVHDSEETVAAVEDAPAEPAQKARRWRGETSAGHGANRRRGGVRDLARPVPLLVLALVLALLWAASLSMSLRSEHRRDSDRSGALAAAQSFATTLSSYDSATLDQDFQNVLANSTGTFQTQYTSASESLRTLISKLHGKATGKVLSAGLVSLDGGKAEVVIFVDQTVTNDAQKTPRIDRTRMQMSLEKHNGHWLISALNLL